MKGKYSEFRPAQHDQIVRAVRKEIVSGLHRPGDRLPNRVDLERRFHTTPTTLQKAFTHLKRTGFIVARGRAGTYVTKSPPHLRRYALVFWHNPSNMENQGWSRFNTAVSQAAHLESSEGPMRFPAFYDVKDRVDSEQMQLLESEVAEERLAGLIFIDPPYHVQESPVFTQPGMPRVALGQAAIWPFPTVRLESSQVVDRGLDFLRDCGRRRVALIASAHRVGFGGSDARLYFEAAVQRRGMITFPMWQCPVHAHVPDTARQFTHLLASLPPEQRPDGILINDDHLVEQTALGVMAAGLRAPEEMTLVGHANFPLPPKPALPVTLIGFDARELLRVCVDLIDRQRGGDPVARLSVVAARSESEVSGRRTSPDHAPTPHSLA